MRDSANWYRSVSRLKPGMVSFRWIRKSSGTVSVLDAMVVLCE